MVKKMFLDKDWTLFWAFRNAWIYTAVGLVLLIGMACFIVF